LKSFGEKNETAVINALKEVFAPVTTAVLTTMAAFMPPNPELTLSSAPSAISAGSAEHGRMEKGAGVVK